MSQCTSLYTDYFNKQLKNAIKKHSCIDKDFHALEMTIKTNKENTVQTNRIQLGQIKHAVYKTRLFVLELKSKTARVIWHFNKEKNEFLFIDIYLKNMQENHNQTVIFDAINNYYNNK